ncbi:MAG: hypothetical protein U9N76_08125 [Candidatus Marinimicrobia bacterium]|nr:hypothetical protein [Candidatus Neomarinimicrobiota bacterium]
MKKNVLLIMLLMICLLTAFIRAEAKTKKDRSFGLSASIQDSHIGIKVPFWVGRKTVIAPSFGYVFIEDSGHDLNVGLTINNYFSIKKVAPYFGLSAGSLILFPDKDRSWVDEDNYVDWVVGIAFGLEYFFDKNLSIGIEVQGNATFSDKESTRFGNPGGINFNTGTVIIGSIYF